MFLNGGDEKGLLEHFRHLEDKLSEDIGGLCIYGMVTSDNGSYHSYRVGNEACIAHMMRWGRYEEGTPIAVLYNMKGLGEEVTPLRKRWIEYLMNESPWRYAFIYKDVYNTSGKQFCALRCDVDANYLAVATNIIRLGLENLDYLQSWDKMVQAGVNKELALCLSVLVWESDIKGQTIALGNDTCYGHSVLSYTGSKPFCRLMAGLTTHNEMYNNGVFYEAKCYAIYYDLKDGDCNIHLKSFLRKNVKQSRTKIPARKDILGRVMVPARVDKGYTVQGLNDFWRKYCNESIH